ncbi:MAG: hypothetical protein LBI33_05630 [Propionibacteriaceae bacterium]|jgi:hypothetical protein|nr:hypothetical protein [Propionibacteriaceae bacterium]
MAANMPLRRPGNHRPKLRVGLGLAVALLFGACSVQPVAAPVDDTAFWHHLQVNALEADPPTSVAELVGRADVIVTGRVRGVETGPSAGPTQGPATPLVALVVRADSVIKGELTSQDVKIVVAPFSPVDTVLQTKPAGNQAIFFLKPATQPGYYSCVSQWGLVEDTPDGLVTVVEPVQSALVNAGQGATPKTFAEFVDEVGVLVRAG